jgi:superfamily II DNA or RNA helicase
MQAELHNDKIIIHGKLEPKAVIALARIEGRRRWSDEHSAVFIENTSHNISVVKGAIQNVVDKRVDVSTFDSAEQKVVLASDFKFKSKPFPFQLELFNQAKDKRAFAIFSEQGTGKTKSAIDIMCYKFLTGKIKAVMIFSWPKGVHEQWIDEQIPEHCWDEVRYDAHVWDGKNFPSSLMVHGPELKIFSANIEALNSKSIENFHKFAEMYGDQMLMIIDESQSIKNPGAKRTKRANALGAKVGYRLIMTGTPIAKDLTDEWSQFRFLDPSILGHKYKTTFQREFCVMGGFQMRAVIGHQNLERFTSKVQPHSFRVTKAEALDLPDKVYDRFPFEITDEQKRIMKELKQDFMTQLDNGEIHTVAHAAVLVTKMQQVSCGYLKKEDGSFTMLEHNPRLEALETLLHKITGKTIIWCRFKKDVELIHERYKDISVVHYGDTPQDERELAKKLFLDQMSDKKYFIATPASAGSGLNLQVGGCSTAIYYSNGYNAVERWQSEDRIHRIGSHKTVRYFDLYARGTMDAKILSNLRNKKSLSDLVLDDLRKMLSEI